jgi:hypothetical protein
VEIGEKLVEVAERFHLKVSPHFEDFPQVSQGIPI